MCGVDKLDNTIIDYLTCGKCDEEFPLHNITNFIQHKTLKCDKGDKLNKNVNETNNRIDGTDSKSLFCSSCLKEFSTARGLLKHVQFEHNISIFVSRIDKRTGSSAVPGTECTSDLDNITDSGLDSITANSTIPEPSCCEKKTLSERDVNCPCRVSGHCNSEKEEIISSSPSDIEQGGPTHFCLINKCTDITTNNEGETGICCNDQECCVTIIPGTHEEPLKCCNSVIPKKRKLHMVKHMNGKTDKENLNVTLFKDKSHAIYLDSESKRDCVSNHGSTGEITPVNNTDILTTDREFIQAIDVDNKNNGRVVSPCHNDTFYTPQTVQQSSRSSTNQIEEILSSNIESMDANLILDSNTITYTEHTQDKIGKDSSMKKRKYPTTKPYKCDSCSEAFNQRIHLKKHTSKHTGVKPFKCNECDYSTVEKSHLKVHTRIHTGEKPFTCPYCKYKTAQNSTLNIHLKRRHSDKLFQCNVCPKWFTQKPVLENHLLNHQNSRISPFQDLQMSLNELADDTFNSQIPAPISTSTNLIPSIIGGELPLLSPSTIQSNFTC